MARSSHPHGSVTPVVVPSTVSRLLGQAGALLVEAGAQLAALEHEQGAERLGLEREGWDTHADAYMRDAYVRADVPESPHAATARLLAAAEGVGGVGRDRAGADPYPGSPPSAHDFSLKTGSAGSVLSDEEAAEYRRLVAAARALEDGAHERALAAAVWPWAQEAAEGRPPVVVRDAEPDAPGDEERRLLEGLGEPDVAGKRVPSPWDRAL